MRKHHKKEENPDIALGLFKFSMNEIPEAQILNEK